MRILPSLLTADILFAEPIVAVALHLHRIAALPPGDHPCKAIKCVKPVPVAPVYSFNPRSFNIRP